MTNKKNTKRALLSSALALVMCISMLIGSTFAWFTDSVTSSGNIIQSGSLKVTMEWLNGKDDPTATDAAWKDASEGAIFKSTLWEPGYTEVRHIKIENEGTLALKYKLNIVANGEVSDLADVIDVYYIDPATAAITDRTQLTEDKKIGTLTEVLAGLEVSGNGVLVPAGKEGDGYKSVEIITIALKMQESAGNEYQEKAIGSDFAIQLLATQYTYEEDSFDNQYDKDALYPVVSADELVSAVSEGKSVVLNNEITMDSAVTFESDNARIELDGNDLVIQTTQSKLADDAVLNITDSTGTANLILGDSSTGDEGRITLSGEAELNVDTDVVIDKGSIELSGDRTTTSQWTSFDQVQPTGVVFNMDGGSIIVNSNSSYSYQAIIVEEGSTFNMNGGEIIIKDTATDMYAFCMNSFCAYINLNNGTISMENGKPMIYALCGCHELTIGENFVINLTNNANLCAYQGSGSWATNDSIDDGYMKITDNRQ